MISSFFFWISVNITNLVIWILTDPRGLEFLTFVTLFTTLVIFLTLSRLYEDEDKNSH